MPQMGLWRLYSAQVAGHGTKEPWLPLLFAKRVDTRTEVARMKILIVDDIKENIYLLEAMLKGAGHDIVP